jgi:broad specificity phosphatase PhoE
VNGPSGPPTGVRISGTPPVLPTRLVLIRHGESVCGLSGVVGGPKGCSGLSERGVAQAEALRDRLLGTEELGDARALYTSVLPRAQQTASIAAPGIGGGLEAIADCTLCELHPGDADGLTWSEFQARYGEPDFDRHPDTALCPGGESWSGFVRRASTALRRVASRHEGEFVVVVCHGGVIESSLLEFLPVASRRGRLKLTTDHTSITEWELAQPGWRLLRYNDAGHLANLVLAGRRGATTDSEGSTSVASPRGFDSAIGRSGA